MKRTQALLGSNNSATLTASPVRDNTDVRQNVNTMDSFYKGYPLISAKILHCVTEVPNLRYLRVFFMKLAAKKVITNEFYYGFTFINSTSKISNAPAGIIFPAPWSP